MKIWSNSILLLIPMHSALLFFVLFYQLLLPLWVSDIISYELCCSSLWSQLHVVAGDVTGIVVASVCCTLTYCWSCSCLTWTLWLLSGRVFVCSCVCACVCKGGRSTWVQFSWYVYPVKSCAVQFIISSDNGNFVVLAYLSEYLIWSYLPGLHCHVYIDCLS